MLQYKYDAILTLMFAPDPSPISGNFLRCGRKRVISAQIPLPEWYRECDVTPIIIILLFALWLLFLGVHLYVKRLDSIPIEFQYMYIKLFMIFI